MGSRRASITQQLRLMAVAGTALLAAATLGLTLGPTLPTLLACALLAGAGQGTLDASTNVLVPAVWVDPLASVGMVAAACCLMALLILPVAWRPWSADARGATG